MSAPHRTARLDPRAPLVLDTRELGRRAGAMRRVRRAIPAPANWTLELVRVPPGADVELDLRLESVVDGVLVSGTVTAPVEAECGRCLEPVHDRVVVDVQELFAYEPEAGADDDVSPLDGDFINFEPVARDAVVLGLPLNPVCGEDCAGLCAGCGEPLRDLDPDHRHDQIDPRWTRLSGFAAQSGDTSEAPPEIGS